MAIKIISLPVGGLDWRQWTSQDRKRWGQLMRKSTITTQRDLQALERLKNKYKLGKFYRFEDQL